MAAECAAGCRSFQNSNIIGETTDEKKAGFLIKCSPFLFMIRLHLIICVIVSVIVTTSR